MFLKVAVEATSDCEAIGRGLLDQPANAASSFAYVIVGLALVLWCWNRVPPAFLAQQRPAPGRIGAENENGRSGHGLLVLYGALVALAGLGSVAYHGIGGDGSRWLHDVGFLFALGFIAAHDWSPVGAWDERRRRIAGVAAVVVAVALVVPALTNVVLAILGAIVAVDEVRAWPSRSAGQRRLLLWAAAVFAVAVAVYLTSRTGGTMCEPDSILQGHALWHILTAGVFGLWGLARFGLERR